MFKFVNSLSPSYMWDLLEFSPVSKYTTRQSKTNFINVPHVRIKQQSFSETKLCKSDENWQVLVLIKMT